MLRWAVAQRSLKGTGDNKAGDLARLVISGYSYFLLNAVRPAELLTEAPKLADYHPNIWKLFCSMNANKIKYGGAVVLHTPLCYFLQQIVL